MIPVFCGEYQCAADVKGRLLIPSKIRELFPAGEMIVLVRSLDPCISLYTEAKWNDYGEKLAAVPSTDARDVRRFFYASMQFAEPDAQGRILLPLPLRTYAGIAKSVVVLGCGDHAEVWDSERYAAYIAETRTESIEEILRRNGL